MLKAINELGSIVYAFDLQNNSKFYCPECKSPVFYRDCESKVKHFAHYPCSNCSYGKGESQEHLLLKQTLFLYARNVFEDYEGLKIEIEHPIYRNGTLIRRADLALIFPSGYRTHLVS